MSQLSTPNFTAADFYLSPQGNDRWSGRLAAPAADQSDGPFATLGRARQALRQQGRPGAVWLRGGDYILDETFTLDAADSGAPEQSIVYCAYPGETPRLLGGRRVSGFHPISDPAVRARLSETAREAALELDLRAAGIGDFGRLRSRGFGRQVATGEFGQDGEQSYKKPAAHLELFFNGAPMTLARWPNDAYTTIAGYAQAQADDHGGSIGALESGFYYEGDRPQRWQQHENIWVHGYWAWDWANSYEQIASIDLERKLITTAPPYGNYGFRPGNRFYFLNVLEELDAPGEYFVDQPAGKLYFWPPADLEGSEVLLSVLETPLVKFNGAAWVTLRGLVFEAGRAEGVVVAGGAEIRIEDCRLRNLGTDAIVIENGLRHCVSGCAISSTGDSGITLGAGDRRSLAGCGHTAENNHIFAIARWVRTYSPAIHASGVGMRIAHNLIHDLPHTAIIYWGNEIVIEFNHIHHVTLETGDAGAIYTGRDYTRCGNLIRYNYIHDTGGYGMGSMGVYLDDCVSGQTVYGNLFVRVQRAVMIGGGCNNLVENNLFIDCTPAIWVDARGMDPSPVWVNMIHETMRERYEAVQPRQSPYRERYPDLLALNLESYFAQRASVPPLNNRIVRNLRCGGVWMESSWHAAAHTYLAWEDNLTEGDLQFVNAGQGNYRLQESSPAWQIGFQPLPLDQIGLQPKTSAG